MMQHSAADRKSIRAAEKASKALSASHAAVLHNLLRTIEGRAWVWSLLSGCHIFATTFTGDPLQSAFAEGERNVGLRLLNDILATCPDLYIQAQREANVRSTTDERRSRPEPDRGDFGPVPAPDGSGDPGSGLYDDPDPTELDDAISRLDVHSYAAQLHRATED